MLAELQKILRTDGRMRAAVGPDQKIKEGLDRLPADGNNLARFQPWSSSATDRY
jgi:hypothetical protein